VVPGAWPSALSRARGFRVHRSAAETLDRRSGRLGAIFTQEGQAEDRTVPLGTYRWKLGFCKSGETGVKKVLQEQIKSSRVGELPGQQRGESVRNMERTEPTELGETSGIVAWSDFWAMRVERRSVDGVIWERIITDIAM
jgi:hypothetical protein